MFRYGTTKKIREILISHCAVATKQLQSLIYLFCRQFLAQRNRTQVNPTQSTV